MVGPIARAWSFSPDLDSNSVREPLLGTIAALEIV
jgi:hypothetical protein